jgi:hypothetical protein
MSSVYFRAEVLLSGTGRADMERKYNANIPKFGEEGQNRRGSCRREGKKAADSIG